MNTKTLGQNAEVAVAVELKLKGHKIIDMNWRRKVCEIDIISEKNKVIYFTEVKFRTHKFQGEGLEYVNRTKQKQMLYAANIWCLENNYDGDYRLLAAGVSWLDDLKLELEITEITLD